MLTLCGVRDLESALRHPGNYVDVNWSNSLMHVFEEWLHGKADKIEAEIEATHVQWR